MCIKHLKRCGLELSTKRNDSGRLAFAYPEIQEFRKTSKYEYKCFFFFLSLFIFYFLILKKVKNSSDQFMNFVLLTINSR